eukprot:2559424-Alexandrium_andersonii.AAC.1
MLNSVKRSELTQRGPRSNLNNGTCNSRGMRPAPLCVLSPMATTRSNREGAVRRQRFNTSSASVPGL